MKLDTSIEMVLMLPIEIAGETEGTRPALAATILECDTVPRDPRRI